MVKHAAVRPKVVLQPNTALVAEVLVSFKVKVRHFFLPELTDEERLWIYTGASQQRAIEILLMTIL